MVVDRLVLVTSAYNHRWRLPTKYFLEELSWVHLSSTWPRSRMSLGVRLPKSEYITGGLHCSLVFSIAI